jgi:hypothetical protein
VVHGAILGVGFEQHGKFVGATEQYFRVNFFR